MMFFSAADILGYSSALTAAAYGRSQVQAAAFLLAAFCFLPQNTPENPHTSVVLMVKSRGFIFRHLDSKNGLHSNVDHCGPNCGMCFFLFVFEEKNLNPQVQTCRDSGF